LTFHDEILTLRDMAAMLRAAGLRGFRSLVRRLGGDPDELLLRHGLTPSSLDDEDALLPIRPVGHLLEQSARSLRCPDFGLQLASYQDVSILGPLAVAIQHSPTVRDALQCASRYLFMHSPAVAFSISDNAASSELAELRYEVLLPGLPPARQAIDLGLGVAHRMIKLIVGEQYRLRAVSLPHTPIAPLSTYVAYFGAPVTSAQPHAALLVPRDFFDTPLPAVNETLRELAVHYLDVHFGDSGQTVTSRVRLAISRSLGTSQSQLDRIATMLAMHPRTLQRHLAAEGTTFEAIRDEVCRQAAMRYLGSTRMPLSQISALLGLSEQSALTRSCKRWFGETPLAIRRRASATSR